MYPTCNDGNARFTTVPLKALIDQVNIENLDNYFQLWFHL